MPIQAFTKKTGTVMRFDTVMPCDGVFPKLFYIRAYKKLSGKQTSQLITHHRKLELCKGDHQMSTANNETFEQQIERFRLRIDNQDETLKYLRQLCGDLFKILEIHRALFEQFARHTGAEIVNPNSSTPIVKPKPN